MEEKVERSFHQRETMKTCRTCVCFAKIYGVVFVAFTFLAVSVVEIRGENSEIFSSTTELEKLFRHESEVVEKLQEIALTLEKDLMVIKKYIDDFHMLTKEGPVDSAEVVANPFNAYHILKRTTVDWEDVVKSISNQTKTEDLVGEILRKSENLPTFEDFIGGSMALVGLQDTYQLNLSDIIHGRLSSGVSKKRSPYELSARDCLFLGKAAFNKGLYDRAVNWLETALTRSEEESYGGQATPTATLDEIKPFLETTKRVHDQVLEKKGPHGETWQTFGKPLNETLARKKKYQKMETYKPILYTPISISEELENFKSLCRDEELRTPDMDARLRCRYRRRLGSASYLAPFKIEEKSLTPYVLAIHDFMSDQEMAEFRRIASPRLKRSLHQGRNGGYVATDTRTSKQAWLGNEDGPLSERMSQRIEALTGLELDPELTASELFQVANYGMAGKYNPHTDYMTGPNHLYSPIELKRGNRIATFMVYLDDVEAGGATVFPLIGVKVKPQKGMGVFWWNLRYDGGGDPLTRHGGCPVLYGEKWITNKWIRYNAQHRIVPCLPKGEDFIQEI